MPKNKNEVEESENLVFFYRQLGSDATLCLDCYPKALAASKDIEWENDWVTNVLKPGNIFQCRDCGIRICENREDWEKILTDAYKQMITGCEKIGEELVKNKDIKGLDFLIEQIGKEIEFWKVKETKIKNLRQTVKK